MTRSPDWDALAPYWEHFEDGGLGWQMIEDVSPFIRPPLLYVGGGLGGLTVRLAQRFGAVLSVDRSLAMCQGARQKHGITCLAADGTRLPLRDACFETVLCASGVLEYLDHAGRARLLAELGRVCRPGGQVVAWAACGDNGVHWDTDQHALVRAWFAGRPVTAFEQLANTMGDRTAARTLLLTSMPSRGQSVSSVELSTAAAEAGLRVIATYIGDEGIARWRLLAE